MKSSAKCPECGSLWINHKVQEAKICGQNYAIKCIMRELDKVD